MAFSPLITIFRILPCTSLHIRIYGFETLNHLTAVLFTICSPLEHSNVKALEFSTMAFNRYDARYLTDSEPCEQDLDPFSSWDFPAA